MTIQDLGSIGALIAAIATVATLLYLASQIRGNTIAMKAEARRAGRIDAIVATRLAAGSDETAEKEWRMGTTDREELEAVRSHVAPLLSSPGGQYLWKRHRQEYPAELQEYIDSLLAAA